MTNVNQNVERAFFVTHVYDNGPYLNICGQFDREGSRQIESLILMLKDIFDKDIGCVTNQTVLIPNTICCAFHEDNYYRAKIIKVHPDSNVFVQFIDYGNFEVVHRTQIRLLECHNIGLKLQILPPIAFEFPLTKVVPFNNVWSRCIVEHVKNILRYNEHPVVVTTYGNRQIFTLYFNGIDFSEYLTQNQMALPAPFEHVQSFRLVNNLAMNQSTVSMSSRQQPHDIPPELHTNNNYIPKNRPAKLVAPPKIESHPENWRKPQQKISMRPPPAISPRSQDIPAFKSRTLEKGSIHKVVVSDVDDGPLKFSVQLESCAQELETLMKSINSLPLKPLSEPPIPSSACLGRFSQDKRLRRAVVSAVNDTLQAKVFYVDFGNQETLGHTDIYEIPPQYANPPLLSVRFILSGVRDLTVTKEMKEYFKELVLGKSLTLKVMPVEDSPLMHYGNLYLDDKSVLDLLRENFPDSAIKFPDPPRLPTGSRENVHVSYSEACNKFFVQLDKNVIERESLSTLLTRCVKIAPPIKPAHVKPGLKCLAHCGVDSQWYRAEVIQVIENQVTVHYVDYGNDETIPSNAIRSIRDDNVTKIPILAIQCILNGFESEPLNSELHEKFEACVLDKPFVMSVIEERPSAIIVDLYDINTKPIVSVSKMLQNQNEPNVQQPITHWQNQESDISSKNLQGKSEETDKWSAKKVHDSSEASYENSSFEEVKIKNWKNTENEDKRYNNRDQKWNNSSGDRFNRDNSRNDRYNRDSGSRYDRNDRNDTNNRFDNENSPNNRYRDKSNGRRGYSSENNRRSDRNSGGENSWSDKDSNASSRSSSKRGRRGSGRGASRGGRGTGGSRRDGTRFQGRDSDGDNDRGFKYNRSNDRDFNKNGGSRVRGDNRNDNKRNDYNDRYQNNNDNSWNTGDSSTANDCTFTSLQIPPPNITTGAVKHCEVVFSASPTDFYVQLIPDNKDLDSVMARIAEIYENSGTNVSEFNAKVGMNCIAQYSEDLKWYRAVIQELCDTNGATVRFVDYGNTELVSFDKIKEIEREFIKLPTQAIHVKLLGASKNNWENSEIEKFTALTEMKTLEAEFVALDNNIYEILVREIVDNHCQDFYINEEFSGGVDLIQAKEIAKSRNKSVRQRTSTLTSPNYAPLDKKWSELPINVGTTEDVIVTWLSDPNLFYCQVYRDQTAFRSMMNEIQNVYSNRQPVTDTLQVGNSVIATFVEDGAFYRAEVTDIKSGRTVVRFVDYGNSAMVQSHEIFRVEQKFMDLPKQAVCCSLKNIIPPDENNWHKANAQEIDNIFNIEKFQCSFLEIKNDKYLVSLKNNDDDIGSILVEKGLASYETSSYDKSQNFQPSNVPEIDGGHINIEGELTKVDISYLKEQTLRVKVSNIESVQKFYIQLPSVLENEKLISDFMAAQNHQVMPKLLPEEVCLGTGCLIHNEKGWRRATVIDCSRKTDFDVRFIDTGETEVVSLNNMLALPGELTSIQKQAVECCLKNVTSSVTIDEQLKSMIENKEVIIRVDSLKKNVLVVDLFDELGHKIVFTPEQEDEKICPLCPMPIFYGVHRVSVAHINHGESIWLKRLVDLNTDADLLSELYDYYSTSGQPLNVKENELCAALSSDGNWYRARVVSKTDSKALIQYIDYGNTENIPFNSLKELETQFFKPSQLAIEVSLEYIIRGNEAEQQELLNPHLLNKEFYATLYKRNKKWFATLGVNPRSKIEEDPSFQELIVDTHVEKSTESNEPDDLLIGNEYKVILSYIDSPTEFWIQRIKNLSAIHELSSKLQEEISTYPPVTEVPEEKLLCAVFNTEKQLWCRAEIIDADEEIATVRFVDYGNTDTVMRTEDGDKIKHLPSAMKCTSWYAVKCRLNVIPIDFEDWSPEACSAFTSKITTSLDLKAILIADNVPKRVELYSGDECISEWLVKEGWASKIGVNDSVIDELVDLELDPKSAFISHINSPSEFWVQEERSVADLELIADRFLVADMFPKVDKVEIGNLYVAKYPEDSSWYRARAISYENESTNVLYVDYGNSALSTEIREIPDDLTIIPPLSRKCKLVLPDGIKEWSEEACQEFIKMSNDGATIFIMDIVEEGETSVVTLTLDGEDIVNHLVKFCKKSKPVTSDNFKIVLVSHISSPNEFWVHEKDSLDDLDTMTQKLLHARDFPLVEEVKEGELCVAEFPEDTCWYRAEVLSHGDTGTNVMYVDYGNTAVSTEIRKIPKELSIIQPLAKKCSLYLPEGIDQWTDEACEEFCRLSNDGNTEFIMTVVEAELNAVKLMLKGIENDISKYLESFCEKKVPMIEKRLSPLGQENSPNIVVSHVVSPAEFWTQAERKIAELEKMATHLVHAESFLTLKRLEEGMICAAKFPEDGGWYRAKILSHGDNGTEVLYIDYGNSAISNEVKALPEDIIKIPPLSKLCSLKLPENIETWSQEACEKFIELVADGATMFEYKESKFLGENPTYVSLFYNGKDIVEILEPLCKKVNLFETSTDVKESRHLEKFSEKYQNDEKFIPIETAGVISNIKNINKLKLSPEIMNSTLKPHDDTSEVLNNVTASDKNIDVDDTILITDSTTEHTVELSQTSDDENDKKKHSNNSVCCISSIKEVRNSAGRINIRLEQDADTSASKEFSFKMVRRNSLPFQDIEDAAKNSETYDSNKSEISNLDKKMVDDKKSESNQEITLSRPVTPKTPHSEKLVAGVVIDHRMIEEVDDEIIEIEVIQKKS
ncbi:maternal protein tudor-like isoform X2 [Chelonus insularis]|uniref:maternal protein tudor-like isoform X2 n=1 Tax=Chelonus insularis TaxID=460826 RepID=UPI0015894139|nr:maternal protein tudor-like isoform X2 [Chelonus insularis]